MTNNSEKKENYTIYIIGQKGLENELLLNFLQQATDPSVMCSLHNTLSFIDFKKTKSSKSLVLCNCHNAKAFNESKECERHKSAAPPDYYWACFNVPHDHKVTEDAISNGVNGIFYENDSLATFMKGIKAIFNEELWFSRDTLSSTLSSRKQKNVFSASQEDSERIHLTKREKEILKLIALGESNDNIAEKLNISILTVKTHVSNIYAKIDVPNRIQAIFWATKNFLHLKD